MRYPVARTDINAVLSPSGCPIITSGDDLIIVDDHGPTIVFQTSAALSSSFCNLQIVHDL